MNGRSGSRPQLIVAANRLPVRRVETPDGSRWETSPGGLVSALAPVLRERDDAVWVGWAGNTGPAPEPFTIDGFDLHPIGLSAANIQQYYEGFANGSLWPLYHDAIAQPEYHRTWWEAYVRVNHRFADAIADIAQPDATVWIHDYQLQLVPAMLRQRMPDLHIGFFLHIPFPARELFLRLPWRTQIVEGLLGADLVGFQSKVMAHNFR
ncbi:MAG: trehalose-6-phosphate synthase, partial [Acidimicrobiia bacterium]|nr:trehalose-6-phosphate synthase [Acidimicrobiia bacterium]